MAIDVSSKCRIVNFVRIEKSIFWAVYRQTERASPAGTIFPLFSRVSLAMRRRRRHRSKKRRRAQERVSSKIFADSQTFPKIAGKEAEGRPGERRGFPHLYPLPRQGKRCRKILCKNLPRRGKGDFNHTMPNLTIVTYVINPVLFLYSQKMWGKEKGMEKRGSSP